MGKQNFHNSTLQLASLYSRIPLLVVGASSVHAVRGLICTRGPGPRLYTRNGFALCTTVFLQLCIYVCKSKVPTHPSQLIRRPECMQVQGMLSSHPPQPLHQPTQWCPCMKSYLKVCVCVCTNQSPKPVVCTDEWLIVCADESLSIMGMYSAACHPLIKSCIPLCKFSSISWCSSSCALDGN